MSVHQLSCVPRVQYGFALEWIKVDDTAVDRFRYDGGPYSPNAGYIVEVYPLAVRYAQFHRDCGCMRSGKEVYVARHPLSIAGLFPLHYLNLEQSITAFLRVPIHRTISSYGYIGLEDLPEHPQ